MVCQQPRNSPVKLCSVEIILTLLLASINYVILYENFQWTFCLVSSGTLNPSIPQSKPYHLSCFRAQPGRQRNESGPVADRVAFRLCIDAAHRDKLLDSSKWPDSVTVSEWYYIDPSRDRNLSNRGQRGAQGSNNHSETLLKTTATAATDDAAVGCPSTASDTVIDTSDMESETVDTTIIYNDGISTATANSTWQPRDSLWLYFNCR